jgi:hypothetical protein
MPQLNNCIGYKRSFPKDVFDLYRKFTCIGFSPNAGAIRSIPLM